jgi:AcrR family transcriptional regulator
MNQTEHAGDETASKAVETTAQKPPRADARRNRLRVLAAAKEAFEAEGASVSVETIARRAGVGVGTVYRHFPTKEALFEAIIITTFSALLDEARALADAGDPGAALYGYLARVFEESETSKAIKDALGGSEYEPSESAQETFRDLEHAVGVLLERAQAAGEARADVTAEEVFALVGGACQASSSMGIARSSSLRLCSVICDGLRPPAARP